eukprot:TRINITY_DN14837_c1_g6_i1.p1 TRINITY_DN14837_c1_g6~~TRINITY_DN14837_c1_g6_i1.p1  ORF type:complete len:126 (+),score=12.32 TRINITY_DN14837_c1_g6_i1:49-426(+)
MSRAKILWQLSLYTSMWKIWLERNNEIFRCKSKSVDEIVQYIVWTVSKWESNAGASDFVGIRMEVLHRSWASCFNGGRCSKMVSTISWHSPPKGVLKMNFDGRFVYQIVLWEELVVLFVIGKERL